MLRGLERPVAFQVVLLDLIVLGIPRKYPYAVLLEEKYRSPYQPCGLFDATVVSSISTPATTTIESGGIR